MKAKRYSISSDEKQSLFKKVFKNIFSSEVSPFQPKKMRDFLLGLGYSAGGLHYYVFINKDRIDKNIKYFGMLSLFKKELFFSEGQYFWRIPYEAISGVKLLQQAFFKEKSIKISFMSEDGMETYYLAVAVLLLGKAPSFEAVDKNKTEELYGFINRNLSLKVDDTF